MLRRRSPLTAFAPSLALVVTAVLMVDPGARAAPATSILRGVAAAQVHPDDPIGALEVGSILVATRRVGGPTFAQSVVLLFAYSEDGAAGLIVNRPSTVPIDRLLPDLPVPSTARPNVFLGGPVSVEGLRALIRAPVGTDDARQLLPGVHLLADRHAVDAAAAEGMTADRLRVYAGYAGWGADQLESEIRRGDWHVFDGDGATVFDTEPESLWERRIRITEALAV